MALGCCCCTSSNSSNSNEPIINDNHDFVEIGDIKWATMNVGANSITDPGLYFQWGDTQGYTAEQVGDGEKQKFFGINDCIYYNKNGSYTKYNETDGKTVLEASDDAVKAAWGGNWRMPTISEFIALDEAVTSVWTADYQGSGVSGLVLTDKTDSSKVLFFPAVGRCDRGNVDYVGSYGYCWSSSVLADCAVTNAYHLNFGSDGVTLDSGETRYCGLPVRGILSEN